MVEILQGFNYLLNKNKFREPLVNKEKSDIEELEGRFHKGLNDYKRKYKAFARFSEHMNEGEKGDLKDKIKNSNQRLMDISHELYQKISGIKQDDKSNPAKHKSVENVEAELNKYEKFSKYYDEFMNKTKIDTFNAQEEDYKLKSQMGKVRYIIWGSLAIITFVSAIIWLVMNIEFPRGVKGGIIFTTSLVALGFLSAIWTVAIKYCRASTQKSIPCKILFSSNKFFNGVLDYLQTIV